MARYSAFLGRRVEVQYRAGDILLPASGVFVADSGRSIFLEQTFCQRGQPKHFRWEIPYRYIVRIDEKVEPVPEVAPNSAADANSAAKAQASSVTAEEKASNSVRDSGGAPSLLPFQNRPKTA